MCPEIMDRKGSVAEAPTLSEPDGAAVTEASSGAGKSSVPSSGSSYSRATLRINVTRTPELQLGSEGG